MTLAAVLLLGLQTELPAAGEVVSDFFGVAVDAAGDRNGDGVPDLWIGDPSGPMDGVRAGRVWLVSGRTGEALLEIAAPAGVEDLGWRVCAIGDADRDGVDDVAVTALFVATDDVPLRPSVRHGEPSRASAGVLAFSGASGALLRRWLGPVDLAGVAGHTFDLGPRIEAVDGLDGSDGSADLAIGWSAASGEHAGEGRVDVVSARSGRVLRSWSGERAHERLGHALCAIGDVDGDGKPDLVAGTGPRVPPERKEPVAEPRGALRVLGSRGREVARVVGDRCARFATSLARVPASGDEPERVAVGQCGGGCHERVVRLVDPRDGAIVATLPEPASREWNGDGRASARRSFGRCVVPLGDRDDDDVPDLLVTAPEELAVRPAVVLSRRTGRLLAHVDVGEVLELGLGAFLGATARAIGDLDGDGTDDVALGGRSLPFCGPDCTGAVLVVSGATLAPLRRFTRARLAR